MQGEGQHAKAFVLFVRGHGGDFHGAAYRAVFIAWWEMTRAGEARTRGGRFGDRRCWRLLRSRWRRVPAEIFMCLFTTHFSYSFAEAVWTVARRTDSWLAANTTSVGTLSASAMRRINR